MDKFTTFGAAKFEIHGMIKIHTDASCFTDEEEFNFFLFKLFLQMYKQVTIHFKITISHTFWYIYYWTLVPESVRYSYFKMNRDLLIHLQEQLEQEKVELFFVCKTTCIRMNFDHAMDFEFRCPECGELVHQDDKQKKVAELEEKIVFVKQELAALQEVRKEKRKKVKEKKKERKVKKKVALKVKKKPTKSPIQQKISRKDTKKLVKSKKK